MKDESRTDDPPAVRKSGVDVEALFAQAFSSLMAGKRSVAAHQANLDAIFNAGRIEGRLTALLDPMQPHEGQTWHRRDNPDDRVEIEIVGSDARSGVHVYYRHINPGACACGSADHGLHARRKHVSNGPAEHFTKVYALTQPTSDHLIESWQRIVDEAR